MSASLASEVRSEFPTLEQQVADGTKPLIYLDSAATSQKPRAVLDALDSFYVEANANVHRGAHTLAARATERYEAARDKVAAFVNAESRDEIVFTAGASESINLVAQAWGSEHIREGDEILLSVMEHHSNLVPWQLLAKRTGATLRFVGMDEKQNLDMDEFHSLLSPKTKLVALAHMSNVLGTVNPVRDIIDAAHAVGAKVMLDGCQSVPHMPVDVRALDCDFLVASGHKMCGPTGIGFLYGKYDVLSSMAPWQGGGEMIDEVFLTHSTYAPPPGRFEAGTPAIAQAVGLGAACDFLSSIGMDRVQDYEHALSRKLWDTLSGIEGLDLYGPPPQADGSGRGALVAFNSQSVHASDLTFFLDQVRWPRSPVPEPRASSLEPLPGGTSPVACLCCLNASATTNRCEAGCDGRNATMKSNVCARALCRCPSAGGCRCKSRSPLCPTPAPSARCCRVCAGFSLHVRASPRPSLQPHQLHQLYHPGRLLHPFSNRSVRVESHVVCITPLFFQLQHGGRNRPVGSAHQGLRFAFLSLDPWHSIRFSCLVWLLQYATQGTLDMFGDL